MVPQFGNQAIDQHEQQKAIEEKKDRQDYLSRIGIQMQGKIPQQMPSGQQRADETSPTQGVQKKDDVTQSQRKPAVKKQQSRFSKLVASKTSKPEEPQSPTIVQVSEISTADEAKEFKTKDFDSLDNDAIIQSNVQGEGDDFALVLPPELTNPVETPA